MSNRQVRACSTRFCSFNFGHQKRFISTGTPKQHNYVQELPQDCSAFFRQTQAHH